MERDLAALIKRGNDLRDESAELRRRTPEELAKEGRVPQGGLVEREAMTDEPFYASTWPHHDLPWAGDTLSALEHRGTAADAVRISVNRRRLKRH
jgi:hypothetical protein